MNCRASMLQHELDTDIALISDDAKQFQILGFLQGLCWLHAERHVAGLIPLSDTKRTTHMQSRDDIWTFYQRLKQYRIAPTPGERVALSAEFDRIFVPTTSWRELNEALLKILASRERKRLSRFEILGWEGLLSWRHVCNVPMYPHPARYKRAIHSMSEGTST